MLLHCGLLLGFANELGRLRKSCSLIVLIVNRKTRNPNPHVRAVAATLARFSARNFSVALLLASIMWTQERLPVLNAHLFGDKEARVLLGNREGKNPKIVGRTFGG